MSEKKAKNGKLADITADNPTVVEYKGLKWLVKNRNVTGDFKAKKKNGEGNPESVFVGVDNVSGKEYNDKVSELEGSYDTVSFDWGWDILTLFREEINKGGVSKKMQTCRLQREYKNGKWQVASPIKIEDQLNGSSSAKLDEETLSRLKKQAKKLGWKAYAIGAAIVALCILVGTELYVLLKR